MQVLHCWQFVSKTTHLDTMHQNLFFFLHHPPLPSQSSNTIQVSSKTPNFTRLICNCQINLLFLTTHLHCLPFFSLQSAVQQGSSLRWRRPESHSSPSSTRELPHKLLVRTLKHCGALTLRVRLTEALLQLENRWNKPRCEDTVHKITVCQKPHL